MPTISDIKQREIAETPVLLFDCEMPSGRIERWSTHQLEVSGRAYSARVLKHNAFELRSTSEDGIDGISKVSIALANPDSYFSELERTAGFKGSRLTVRFLFTTLNTGAMSTDEQVIFKGIANAPEEITEKTFRLSFMNRLSLQRTMLPNVRIQRRCPWAFPSTAQQRAESVTGGEDGRYSPFFKCGYSPDMEGGTGTLANDTPFVSCDYSRKSCEQRGMFSSDASGRPTRRFGGLEFVPSSILVKSYGDKSQHLSTPVENEVRYNDFVPLVYGTAWYRPPIVFARNDGNLTRMEVLLGMGEIEGVVKVITNGVEIPPGQAGKNMTATGWFNVVSAGGRAGAFNSDFADGAGRPAGDPYGSMAVLSVVVPNRISDGTSLPKVEVLLKGLRLDTYDRDGNLAGERFTNNPAWVILDLLRRTGWTRADLDLPSFAETAAYCDDLIATVDGNGTRVTIPRFQCNLVVSKRRTASDVIRGVRNGSGLFLAPASNGRLQLLPEGALALLGSSKPEGTNSTTDLEGGWPAYEFGDGTSGFTDILRKSTGEPAVRMYSRPSVDSPNRFTVEFQDEFNEYQQDSLSLVDLNDSLSVGQEITAALTAVGLPNFNQAGRIARLQLNRSVQGNVYLEFETGLRGIGLRPGQLITITYLKEGLERQLFRILKIAPGLNFATSLITAQIHRDEWYVNAEDPSLALMGGGRQPDATIGLPRPIAGVVENADGGSDFAITEQGGEQSVSLTVAFAGPQAPSFSAPPIPTLSLEPSVATDGGTIRGGLNHFYAITALAEDGSESQPSFLVRAETPGNSNTNAVVLRNLSFGAGTAAFNVYRGETPAQLFRIAGRLPNASTYTDTGSDALLATLPDHNYDHTNLYWRFELQPESPVTDFSATSICNSALHMTANQFRNRAVRIVEGTGRGQERIITANTASTLTISPVWDISPDATSTFAVSDAAWQFGAVAKTSPGSFQVPRRDGATVEVCGRAANVHNRECAYELSPVTRHRLAGSAGSHDLDVAGAPGFGLQTTGSGTVDVVAVGFQDLANTSSVTAGTLTLLYYDELHGPAQTQVAEDCAPEQTALRVSGGHPRPGELLQIGQEVCAVTGEDQTGTLTVERGKYGSMPAAHPAATVVWPLQSKTFVLPFVPDLFGSPAAAGYCYSVALPNARIAAGELYVTNSVGRSASGVASFTSNDNGGLRTLSGGQMSMQVEGYLAIQDAAVPPLLVDATRSVRDIFAVVQDVPMLAPVQLMVTLNDRPYCALEIPVGERISNVAAGQFLPVLHAMDQLGLNIVSVGQTALSAPGRDLTVVVRL